LDQRKKFRLRLRHSDEDLYLYSFNISKSQIKQASQLVGDAMSLLNRGKKCNHYVLKKFKIIKLVKQQVEFSMGFPLRLMRLILFVRKRVVVFVG